ncbi:MAG: zinc-ribbon domain-containing protein [Clostridia bacterium]|nr:zinc-ribbon domain-containing protein [Clostridia bacterium]
MRKPDFYIVEPKAKEGYCTWEIDLNALARNAAISVSEGCRAVYYINGAEKRTYTPRSEQLIVNTRAAAKEGVESVVGVNEKQPFTILWGLGDVPYKDAESGINTKIGMHGEFKFTVKEYGTLMNSLGVRDITPEDVKKHIFAKYKETLSFIVSSEIKGAESFRDLAALQKRISDRISRNWEDELMKIGLELNTTALSEVKFDDDFLERINGGDYEPREKEENPMEKFVREHEEKATLESFAAEDTQVTCPVCGKKLAAGAKFCDKCGAPIVSE